MSGSTARATPPTGIIITSKWKFGARARVWFALAAIAGAALALRCVHLDDRPMHTDEAVHAVILGGMLETGVYRYNPHDSHGPLLYDLAYPWLRCLGVHDLAGMEAWHLRAISALIGAATICSLGFWLDELGNLACLAAAALLALSAPFVYYQRYFIHEGLFILLTLALLRCVWAWGKSPGSIAPAMATGLLGALLFATKETAPLVVLALGLAGLATWLTDPARFSFRLQPFARNLSRSLLAASATFVLVFALLYSSFGANPHGMVDALTAFLRFFHRAGGEGHEKPWWTFFGWLWWPNRHASPWSGWIIFGLALVGAVRSWNTAPLIRLLSFFTVATAAFYSLIPYKTPWLELNLLAPAILLAGVGAAIVLKATRAFRPAQLVVALLLFCALILETTQICFLHPADDRNPLAYAPTVPDIDNLATTVSDLKSTYPADAANFVAVISTDYWPLPWYLRRLQPVGYWSEIPTKIDADIVITSPELFPPLQARLGPGWKVRYFGLRPDVLAIVLSRPPP